MAFAHQTVLLEEAISFLKPGDGKVIVDATLGGGGHAEALLRTGAQVIGLDQDPRALEAASSRLGPFKNFRPVLGNFENVQLLLEEMGALPVQGILLDLGVSSPQLDQPERGFSFQTEGPLDMRMGNQGPTAALLIEQLDVPALTKIIRDLGDEPFAHRIAAALKKDLPKTTQEAVRAIERAVPRKAWPKKIHVATRTFQALRMAVNHELESLDAVLGAIPHILSVGGVAAAISFHSLEDRKVKHGFRALVGQCTCPPGLPVCACGAQGAFALLTRKAVTPSAEEQRNNPRSRSAHLRAVEKIR